MAIGAFISTGKTLDQAVERVRLAESLGYDAAYVTHIAGRDSLTVCTAYALATERIRVGTGVIPIYTRTPASMAQVAATIARSRAGAVTRDDSAGEIIGTANVVGSACVASRKRDTERADRLGSVITTADPTRASDRTVGVSRLCFDGCI